VQDFARAIQSLGRAVDIQICNAGIMATPLAYAPGGVESQLMTNYVGHALLVSLLGSMLRRAGRSRVVSLASLAHQLSPVVFEDLNFRSRPYDKWKAYGQSKTACSLLAVHVSGQMRHDGVTALAVHPGIIVTALGRYLSEEERRHLATRLDGEYKSVKSGAATSVWAATAAELEGHEAAYLEDCQIAQVVREPNNQHGVMPYALDADQAARLWGVTGGLLGEVLPL
jgi:NAD(P)-dependent dehydrogenase (short-subunit alcohol dehydrogenase family)